MVSLYVSICFAKSGLSSKFVSYIYTYIIIIKDKNSHSRISMSNGLIFLICISVIDSIISLLSKRIFNNILKNIK